MFRAGEPGRFEVVHSEGERRFCQLDEDGCFQVGRRRQPQRGGYFEDQSIFGGNAVAAHKAAALAEAVADLPVVEGCEGEVALADARPSEHEGMVGRAAEQQASELLLQVVPAEAGAAAGEAGPRRERCGNAYCFKFSHQHSELAVNSFQLAIHPFQLAVYFDKSSLEFFRKVNQRLLQHYACTGGFTVPQGSYFEVNTVQLAFQLFVSLHALIVHQNLKSPPARLVFGVFQGFDKSQLEQLWEFFLEKLFQLPAGLLR